MEENILSQNKSLIQSLASNLSPDGGRRCLLLVGRDRHVKPVVENLAKLLIDRQESYLWIDFDGRSRTRLNHGFRIWLAISVLGWQRAPQELGEFARETGRLLLLLETLRMKILLRKKTRKHPQFSVNS